MERREGPCSPENGEELRQARATCNVLAWLFGGSGFLLLLLALPGAPGRGPDAWTVFGLALGLPLFCASLTCMARRKGWHPAWGLLGFAFLVGLLVIFLFPVRCGWCGAVGPRREEYCPACSAPLGHRLPSGRPPGER